jgi:hypothetical protein
METTSIADPVITLSGCPAATPNETCDTKMAAYFCSQCRTNWPVGDAYKSCPDCDQLTFHNTTADPDVNASLVEHAAVGT